uniref:HCF145 n=1 Tax=Hesperocyparis macrocarpa TaxID=76352 RepID=A0A3Q8BPR3_9CONI|nr:HCF145 [Hesperocyparis macrocarpa]
MLANVRLLYLQYARPPAHTARYDCNCHRSVPHSLAAFSRKGKGVGFPVGKKKKNGEEEGGKVECQVEVISWRERRVSAAVVIEAEEQSVWEVLTDYERLAEFIPNLVLSEVIQGREEGRVRLRQRGMQRNMYWHIEAQVVLDLQELPHLENGKELHFSMVEGDFKQYEGKWCLRLGPRPRTTKLYYEVNVIPRFNFPAIFVERIIRKDLPLNLQSVAARAEAKSGSICKDVKALYHEIDHMSESAEVKDNQSISTLDYLCRISINDLANAWNNWVTTGQRCSLDRPCIVDEVHLRRLDDLLENGGVHRRVIATITIKAPCQSVWKVLTAYESLSDFVPNLAISKIISRENNKVCLLQEGCKGLLYMVLHARIVLDLWEHPEHEILFEQVEGDFDSFRGNWILEQLGSQHTLLKYVVETKMQKNCLLAEAIVEEVIYKDLPSNLCALRDHVENKETADLNFPAALTFSKSPKGQNIDVDIKDLNLKKSQGATKGLLKVSEDKPTKQRSKVPGLQTNMDILKAELYKFISNHGQEGFMPLRKHLRLHGRSDLEKAITRMGGFRIIASLMNLSLSYKNRKPKGYWDSLENLKQEVNHFQRTWGMDLTYMPSRKSFERAGRYDLARAFEKWGGLHEVSRLLKLKLRHPRESMSPLGQEDDDGVFKLSIPGQGMSGIHPSSNNNSTSNSSSGNENSKKWLAPLDELNPN